jgi:spermidine synthase
MHENPFYTDYSRSMIRAHKRIKAFFNICKVLSGAYTQHILRALAFRLRLKKISPVKDIVGRKVEFFGD